MVANESEIVAVSVTPPTDKLIAVYGTLKHGGYNHYLLDESALVGLTKVKGSIHVGPGYPVFVPGGSKDVIMEVYRVRQSVFDSCNRMEIGAGYTPYMTEINSQTVTYWGMPNYEGQEFGFYNPITWRYE